MAWHSSVRVFVSFLACLPCCVMTFSAGFPTISRNSLFMGKDLPLLSWGCARSTAATKAAHLTPRVSGTKKSGHDIPLAMEFQPIGGGSAGTAVKKLVLEEGSGELAKKGAEVQVEYSGTIAKNGWSAQDVVECWLSGQQGMDVYSKVLMDGGVDGDKLVAMTEEDLQEMGVSNKIHCKKLAAAVKRLQTQHTEVPVGTVFDSTKDKGPFSFTLGKGKVIKGWETAVATMKQGERAQFLCRADFAYGADGLRKKTGEVVVPPFSTLLFEIKLIKC